MSNTVRWFLFPSVCALLLAGSTVAFAQADPEKALVGSWTGQIEISGNSARQLIINSVKAKGEGEWVARGRYGFPDQLKAGPGGQEMIVSSKDNQIFVEFVVGSSKNPVQLKLMGDNKLEGTINMVAGGRSADRRISFEKVGDVK
jgi:hypothetical protein